jgi:hypothetical protein
MMRSPFRPYPLCVLSVSVVRLFFFLRLVVSGQLSRVSLPRFKSFPLS